jgi:hypothetical protein
MPEIVGTHDFLGDMPLRFSVNLLGVEHPEAWEGWLTYEIALSNGESTVASLSNLSIIDGDIDELCRFLGERTGEVFEPMEPDFQVIVRSSQDEVNDTELLVFLDEGIRRKQGYAGDGVGLRLLASSASVDQFVEELRAQYAALTKDLYRKTYVRKLRNKQSGFGSIALIVVGAVVVLAITGGLVYKHHLTHTKIAKDTNYSQHNAKSMSKPAVVPSTTAYLNINE